MISIITPYFKTYEQTKKLASILIPQLTDQTEWLIIDDGTNDDFTYINSPYVKVIHLKENSGGASVPRNIGLDNAQGEYICFIDSDDLVSNNYIKKILEKTKEEWDYCYISWKTDNMVCIIKDKPPSWNCCIWNCIYKKELIGEKRFRPDLILAEDYDFNKRVRKGKKANIEEILYTYNNTPNSLSKSKDTFNKKYKKEQ